MRTNHSVRRHQMSQGNYTCGPRAILVNGESCPTSVVIASDLQYLHHAVSVRLRFSDGWTAALIISEEIERRTRYFTTHRRYGKNSPSLENARNDRRILSFGS